jgi:hypothetical protein
MRVAAFESLEDLPQGCGPLFGEAGKASFFLTLGWFRNLAEQALPENCRLRIYVADEDGKVLGVLPMKHDAKRGPFRSRRLESLSNYYSSLFAPLAASRNCFQAIVDEIAKERWDSVDFHPLSKDSPAFGELSAAMKKAGMSVQPYYCFGNWYLEVNGRSYRDYSNVLPSRLRNTLKRKGKQFAAMASRMEIIAGINGVDSAIAAYEKVYDSSWKVHEPHPGFMPGLIRLCAEEGWLRLGVAYLENEPVAAQLWIVKDRIASIYKLAYDEKYSKLSAGSLLTAKLMGHVIDVDRVVEVDYLTGDDEYKKDWMSHRRERWGIIAYNRRTLRGIFMWAINSIKSFAGRLAGQRQAVESGCRR